MKRTPQKAMTSASVAGALRLKIEAVADEIGEILDFGLLVIMREDDGVALLAQPVDLGAQVEAGKAAANAVSRVHHDAPLRVPHGRRRRLLIKQSTARRPFLGEIAALNWPNYRAPQRSRGDVPHFAIALGSSAKRTITARRSPSRR